MPVDATDGVSKYIVQSGDSLSRIATKFGTTIEQLKKTNGITSTLRPGQELFITQTNGIIHNAKKETNYLLFANKYNLDLEDLMTLNYVVKEDAPIHKDDEIFLPITMEKAYALGLEERPKPKPKPVLVQRPIKRQPTSTSQQRLPAVVVSTTRSSESVVTQAPTPSSP